MRREKRVRTIEATDDGLFLISLLDDDLDMGVRGGERGDVGVDVLAGGSRGGPLVAVLEDELADGRQVGGVAVCRARAEGGSEERTHGGGRQRGGV